MKKYYLLLIPFTLLSPRLVGQLTSDYYLEGQLLETSINISLMTILLYIFIKKMNVRNVIDALILIGFCIYFSILYVETVWISISYMFNTEFLGHSIFSEPNQSYPLNLIPFSSIIRTIELNPHALYQVVGNMLMFTPFSFAVLYFGLTKNAMKVIFYFTICSLGIELFQLLQSYIASYFAAGDARGSDIDDIILNITSSILGVIAYKIWMKLYILINEKKGADPKGTKNFL